MNTSMQKGLLKSWNKDKAFGFIKPENGTYDIFIHISALKNMNRSPVVGDTIYYEVQSDNKGRKRAVNARIEGVQSVKPKVSPKTAKKTTKNNGVVKLIFIVIIISIGLVFYKVMVEENNSSNSTNPTYLTPTEKIYQQNYSCDGREHCSQMTSCDEAKYFLRNCPNTKMDGNNDGIPCENQWCN